MQKLMFLGDIAIDRYHDQDLPGGCSLNAAARAQQFIEKNKLNLNVILSGPKGESELLDKYLDKIAFTKFYFIREGTPPCQSIRILEGGEKFFYSYEDGVFENFQLQAHEEMWLQQFSDTVIMPIYSQALGFNHQAINKLSKAKIYGDFFNLADFDYDLKAVRPLLDKMQGGFFGLKSSQDQLIEELKKIAIDEDKKILITLGEQGALYIDEKTYQVEAYPAQNVIDTTGAGDTFIAIFMVNLLYGVSIQNSLKLASIEAAKVVGQLGACFHDLLID